MALADAGAEVGLWASDGSADFTPLLPATSPVQRIVGTESEALDRFGEPDILHDNGIWLLHNHRLAALAEKHSIPRVISTRGMLEPWALGHKRLKKKLAWWTYQRRDLQQARCHITTGETEAENLQRLGLGVPIATVPNGVDVAEERLGAVGLESQKTVRNGRTRTALFLGRIYPIKGLPMLIEAWARVRPDGWRLRIAGPDEAGHQRQVERAVSAAGLGEVVSFTGPIEPRNEEVCFSRCRPFCAPDPFGKLWHGGRRSTCSRLAGPDYHRGAVVDSARERLRLVGRSQPSMASPKAYARLQVWIPKHSGRWARKAAH